MLVTATAAAPPDHRDRLAQVLADFRIEGSILGHSARGNLHLYRFAMTGAKKVKRVQALASDIAAEIGVVHAVVTALDKDGLIKIALLTAPYLASVNIVPGVAVAPTK